MSLLRSVLIEAGGFDERLGRLGSGGAGCEETEFCIRARGREADGVIVYDPRARVRHRVPAERATARYFVQRCLGEGASKAVVARLRGSKSLASESDYVSRVLPMAVARALAARQDRSPRRAGAIALGLLTTTFGYARGRVFTGSPPEDPRLVPALQGVDPSGGRRSRSADVAALTPPGRPGTPFTDRSEWASSER